jgi:hypothetical protein
MYTLQPALGAMPPCRWCLLLAAVLLASVAAAPAARVDAVSLDVEIGRALRRVDPRFASVTMDIGGLNRPLLELAPRLADFGRSGPSYFRVGGAAGDCIYWNVSNNVKLPLPPPSTRCANEGPRRVASRQTVDDLLELCERASVQLILGLNSADGRNKTHRSWDPGHTRSLLQYLAAHPLRSVVAGFVRVPSLPSSVSCVALQLILGCLSACCTKELGNEPRSEK